MFVPSKPVNAGSKKSKANSASSGIVSIYERSDLLKRILSQKTEQDFSSDDRIEAINF